MPRDYNINSTFDAADHGVWRNSLRQSYLGYVADDNYGIINQIYYHVGRSNFGAANTNSGAGAIVPELAATLLLTWSPAAC